MLQKMGYIIYVSDFLKHTEPLNNKKIIWFI